MTMDNAQREAEAGNPESDELAKLEEQLREAVAAEDFFNLASGKLFQKLAIATVNVMTKEILSDKYERDLAGYNRAKDKLNFYKDTLKKMQFASAPLRKAKLQEKIEENGGTV